MEVVSDTTTDALAYPQHVAAKVLGVSDRTLRRWGRAGTVTAIEIEGIKLYPRVELERLIAEKMEEARAGRVVG